MNMFNSLRYLFVFYRKYISLRESPRRWFESYKNMENTAEVCQYLNNIIPDDNTGVVHTYYLMIHQVEESNYRGD